MTDSKAQKWLEERGIKLEENFPMALKRLAKTFKKEKGLKNIEEVYALMGLKKQYIAYWLKNLHSIQSKKLQIKYNLCSC